MRKSILLLLHFLFLFELFAETAASSNYAKISDMFGIDPNSGKNSFLSLLLPSGGKYEGMGTAFTAMNEDSGFLDCNPAGSSYIKNSELTFYHNNWIADSNLESVTYTSRWDDFGIGIGGKFLYLPFTGFDSWGNRSKNEKGGYASGYYSETVIIGNTGYTFFNNYYFHGIAAGASFKMAYRHIPSSIASGQSALAFMVDVGMQTKFNILKFYSSRDKNFTLGLVIKNLGMEFISNPDPLPSMISTGIAYSPFRFLSWAFDVNIPFNLDGSRAQKLYFATGLNIGFSSFLSIQTGFLIKTGMPRFSVGATLTTKRFSLTANYSLDLSSQISKLDRLSLALKLNLGDAGRQSRVEKSQSLYLKGLEEYAMGNLEKAIALWKQSLSIRPDFTPAAEMIETAETSLRLNRKIQENQSIDE